jgi:hypothetical protein
MRAVGCVLLPPLVVDEPRARYQLPPASCVLMSHLLSDHLQRRAYSAGSRPQVRAYPAITPQRPSLFVCSNCCDVAAK